MLGATPESSSEAAKPTDDPHGRFTFGTSLDSYTARAPLDSAVSKTSPTPQSRLKHRALTGAPPAADRSYSAVATASTTSSQHQLRYSSTLYPPPASQHEAHARVCKGAMCQDGCHRRRATRSCTIAAQLPRATPHPKRLSSRTATRHALSLRRSGLDESTKRPSPKLMYRCATSHTAASRARASDAALSAVAAPDEQT